MVQKPISRKMQKCINYSEYGLNCSSKYNCLDRCLIQSYLDKYSIINLNHFVDQDFLKNKDDFEKNVTTEIHDYLIEENCHKKFEKEDCNEVYFKCLNGQNLHSDIIAIDLFYEKFIEEEDENSFYKVIYFFIFYSFRFYFFLLAFNRYC